MLDERDTKSRLRLRPDIYGSHLSAFPRFLHSINLNLNLKFIRSS